MASPGERPEQAVSGLARPWVFTNGCFDILHRGHVTYLETAAGMGESLIVALNSDDSVRRQEKHPARPYNNLADRMAVIGALRCVDAVLCFDQDTPLDLIELLRPDVLVKGGDWAVEDIVGGAEVTGWGGSVRSIPFEYQRSLAQPARLTVSGPTTSRTVPLTSA